MSEELRVERWRLRRWRELVHVPLIASLPALAMWLGNPRLVPWFVGLPVVATSILVGLLFLAIFWAILRSAVRGGVLASAASIIFLTIGRLDDRLPLLVAVTVVAALLFLLLAWFVWTSPLARISAVGRRATGLAAVLVVFNVVGIALALPGGGVLAPPDIDLAGASLPPRDIIYIVPDRYTNAAVLEEFFGLDNTPFMDELRARGFEIDVDARSSYPKTSHSLASTLNFAHVWELIPEPARDGSDESPLQALVRDHLVGRIMRDLGHEYVHVGSWWEGSRTSSTADRSYTPSELGFHLTSPTEFSVVFEETTALPLIGRVLRRFGFDGGVRDDDGFHRAYAEFGLEVLESLADEPPGRRFIMAHLLLPHDPYVYGADGGPPDPETPVGEQYVGQLLYTNERLLQVIDRFLDAPAGEQPIILIQADEGISLGGERGAEDLTAASISEMRARLGVLQAVRIPEGLPALPGPVAPVDLFRMLLSELTGLELPQVPDRTFVFPNDESLYDLVEVTDRLD